MKFIHLGDVHLAVKPDLAFPWSSKRAEEVWEGFRKIINTCNDEEVDLLLISGDFFHKQPLVRELKEADYIFSRLKKTRVVIIAGNHDYISSRSNYLTYEWSDNVHMFLQQEMDSIYLEDINTEVYGFSYRKREIREPLLDNVSVKDKDRINILLAHAGTPTNVPFDLKSLERKGFDYIALGHIHTPKKLGDRIAYAGCIEPTNKNDVGRRGYIIGNVEKEGHESKLEFQYREHSAREYIRINFQVNESMTNSQLHDLIREELGNHKENNIFIINLEGYKDPDIEFKLESLEGLGNIIEINDKTIANYDFDQLYTDNGDNIIGSFISYIQESETDEKIKTKALYHGIEALIHARK